MQFLYSALAYTGVASVSHISTFAPLSLFKASVVVVRVLRVTVDNVNSVTWTFAVFLQGCAEGAV